MRFSKYFFGTVAGEVDAVKLGGRLPSEELHLVLLGVAGDGAPDPELPLDRGYGHGLGHHGVALVSEVGEVGAVHARGPGE